MEADAIDARLIEDNRRRRSRKDIDLGIFSGEPVGAAALVGALSERLTNPRKREPQVKFGGSGVITGPLLILSTCQRMRSRAFVRSVIKRVIDYEDTRFKIGSVRLQVEGYRKENVYVDTICENPAVGGWAIVEKILSSGALATIERLEMVAY